MKEIEYLTVNKTEEIMRNGSGTICSARFDAFHVDIIYSKQRTGFSVTLFARLTESGYYALTAQVLLGSDTPLYVMVNYERTVATIVNVVRRKADYFCDYCYTETAVMQGLRDVRASEAVVEAIKKLTDRSQPIRLESQGKW